MDVANADGQEEPGFDTLRQLSEEFEDAMRRWHGGAATVRWQLRQEWPVAKLKSWRDEWLYICGFYNTFSLSASA